jgi:hypothetical protein
MVVVCVRAAVQLVFARASAVGAAGMADRVGPAGLRVAAGVGFAVLAAQREEVGGAPELVEERGPGRPRRRHLELALHRALDGGRPVRVESVRAADTDRHAHRRRLPQQTARSASIERRVGESEYRLQRHGDD